MKNSQTKIRLQKAKQITIIGAIINFLLAILKIIFGLTGRSHALFADGIHSIADVLIDGLVLCVAQLGHKDADEDHPYGHGRIETAGTFGLAMILLLTGSAIIYDAFNHIFIHHTVVPSPYTLVIAAIALIANELLFYIMLKMGRQYKSNLLIANAWHHRGDSAASLVVIIGVTAALYHYQYFDAIAAMIVGLMIIKMAISLGWNSIKELVDTSVPPELVAQIEQTILTVPDIMQLHQLRTRSMADFILVDVHILVQPRLSVSEGHYIAALVTRILKDKFDNIHDVTVHVDYESDDDFELSQQLPSREVLLPTLKECWRHLPFYDNLNTILFHYDSGYLVIELHFTLTNDITLAQVMEVKKSYQNSISTLKIVKSVEVLFG